MKDINGIEVYLLIDPEDVDLAIANIHDFTHPECEGIFQISRMDDFIKTIEEVSSIPDSLGKVLNRIKIHNKD